MAACYEVASLRTRVIDMVLATDMSFHKKLVEDIGFGGAPACQTELLEDGSVGACYSNYFGFTGGLHSGGGPSP